MAKAFKKLSPAQKRDFMAYCRTMKTIKVGRPKTVTNQAYAKSLAHWYWQWDTHGVIMNHPRLDVCWRLVQAKEQMNLTIALWIEDHLCSVPVTFAFEIKEWCTELPSWVWTAYLNSFKKKSKGLYVPEFADPTKIPE